MHSIPLESVRHSTFARSLRALHRTHLEQDVYSYHAEADWQVSPVDILPCNGQFKKVLHVERLSGESINIEAALGIGMGGRHVGLVDRNLHLDCLNTRALELQTEVIDTEIDLRSMTRVSMERSESLLAGVASRRVGLWSLPAGQEEVLIDTVTLLENLVAIDPVTASILLSPLMSPGYEVTVQADHFLFRGDSAAIGDFIDFRALGYPSSQYHRARCLAYWLGCVETNQAMEACRASVITQAGAIQLPVVPQGLPARLTCWRDGARLLVLHVQPLLAGGAWPRRFNRIRLEDARTGVGLDFWERPTEAESDTLAWWGPSRVAAARVTCHPYAIPGRLQSSNGRAALKRLDPVTEFVPVLVLPLWTETDYRIRDRFLAWQGSHKGVPGHPSTSTGPAAVEVGHRAEVLGLLCEVSSPLLHENINLCFQMWEIYSANAREKLEQCHSQVDDLERSIFRAAIEPITWHLAPGKGSAEVASREQCFLEAFIVDQFLRSTCIPAASPGGGSAGSQSLEVQPLPLALVDAIRSLIRFLPGTVGLDARACPLMTLAILAKLLGATSMRPSDLRACLAQTGPGLTNGELDLLVAKALEVPKP